MTTNMTTNLDTELAANEFHLLCDLQNGTILSLEPLNWKQNLFCYYEINNLKSKWKVNSKKLVKKLRALSSLETLELLLKIQAFWRSDDSIYKTVNMISPTEKINEILSCPDRNKTVEWSWIDPIEDFYSICQQSDMDYVIYSQDTTGYNREVWGIAEEYLLNHLSSLSSKHQFSCIQKLSDAILNGFKA
jgi:hypothetical protein